MPATTSAKRRPRARSESTRGASPPSNGVPPLQNGDRLSRQEFERRYDATPGLMKAELIDGVVYMAPPVSHDHHSLPHIKMVTWLGVYMAGTPGVEGGDNGSLRLDLGNMPQPDGYLLILPSHGGQARIDEDGYVEGAPELVAEVSASRASFDLHDKLNTYRRNRVREYVVWRVYDRAVDWFSLRRGRYEALRPDAAGRYRSKMFPGLWLDPAALARGDLAAVLRVLQEGLASPEYAAFVIRLKKAAMRRA